MLRLSCALVVVASVGAAPPIPGSTKATWSMDILRRVRIVECGLAVAKSMGGASYRTTPALQTEWARRLDFDEADFEAITRVGGAGGPRAGGGGGMMGALLGDVPSDSSDEDEGSDGE